LFLLPLLRHSPCGRVPKMYPANRECVCCLKQLFVIKKTLANTNSWCVTFFPMLWRGCVWLKMVCDGKNANNSNPFKYL
jgi:hypothetical protein